MKTFTASLLFFLLSLPFLAWTQQSNPKKPLTDSSAKAKGLLGGRLSTGLESGVEQLKKLNKDVKDVKSGKKDLLKEWGLKDLAKDAQTLQRLAKKKLAPKDEYQGVKTERRLGAYGSGTRATTEEVNVVKYVEDEKINPFLPEIYTFDPKQSRVITLPTKEAKNALICHGPYRRVQNGQVVEEGFFHMGQKDGRWESYGPDFVLENKQYYFQGFPAQSHIKYYDAAKQKIQEVIPKSYGKVQGQYYAFFPNGLMKMEGKLDDSIKIGRWREFHERGRLKREWRYGEDKFSPQDSLLIQERDEQGKIIYQNPGN